MDVSIVIPFYEADQEIFDKVLDSIHKQKFSGRVEILIEKGAGLSQNLNNGIKKAKYPVIITLHQDSVPSDEHWLETLTAPLLQHSIIASVSKVELPRALWETFDPYAKALTLNELGVVKPWMDEKGCAFKKEILEKINYFDTAHFFSGGEDLDMFYKLKLYGDIAYPDCKVIHYHYTDYPKRIRKICQNANSAGTLLRIYGIKNFGGMISLLKSIPLLGFFIFISGYPFKKDWRLFGRFILALPRAHVAFIYGFYKGFFQKRQTL